MDVREHLQEEKKEAVNNRRKRTTKAKVQKEYSEANEEVKRNVRKYKRLILCGRSYSGRTGRGNSRKQKHEVAL